MRHLAAHGGRAPHDRGLQRVLCGTEGGSDGDLGGVLIFQFLNIDLGHGSEIISKRTVETMSFKDFLKRYSAIPNSFIDELFEFYNENTSQSDPSINLNNITRWLGTSKEGILKTLKESYVKDIDYTISKPVNPVRRTSHSNNLKVVLLTPECFKRLCMQSRSVKAHEVRTYFIEIESLLLKYTRLT